MYVDRITCTKFSKVCCVNRDRKFVVFAVDT